MPNIEKNTSIQYEVHLEANEQNTICGSLQNKIVLPENTQSVLSYEEKASKTECLIASACGIITGLLDVFWVGEFSFYDAQTLGREQINDIVINIAASQGCTKKSLEDSIRYLVKKYANPSDKLTNEFGGGLQHHLRDFSHHTSPVGLICSILVQFTGHGYGTDTTGTLVYPVIPEGALIGQTFEEKILYGVLYWVFHLVSDMAGSSNNPGAGTGIPGPLLSLLKEISVLPIFKDKTISLNEKEITFSQWTSKLFNGTALHNTSDKSSIRFDLRTEIGIAYFGIKQSIPVIVNQCVVRAFYFINRLYHELKDKNICTFKDLIKIEPGRVLPFNNRCLTRMITVSSGTFSAIDAIDAAIRSKLSSGCDATNFATGFFMRINFIGIASFAIAIKNDVKNIYIDLKDSILERESENHFLNFIETQAIDIDADMDNTAIYRHRFDELLQFVKRCRKNNDVSRANHPKERHFVFEIKTQEFDDYSKMVSLIENYTMSTIEKTIITVFEQNYIAYEEPKKVDKWKRHFSFIQTERGRRIGYRLAYDRPKEGLTAAYKDYREKTDVDEVRFILPLNPGSKNDKYISMLNECSETNCDSFFRFIYLFKRLF